MTIQLNGEWKLYFYPEEQLMIDHPDALDQSGLKPVPAVVPGNVELDLEAAGILPEIFLGKNIQKIRQFEGHTWWYVREFDVPAGGRPDAWELVCEGLDTLASVWINGVLVGESDNMLVEQRFKVDSALKTGQKNTIAIRLKSVLKEARKYTYDAVNRSWEHRDESLYIRKAPHMYGWDIMPRAVSAGIWKPMRLEQVSEAAIEHIYYSTQEVSNTGAALGVRFQFKTQDSLLEGYSLHFVGKCDDHSFEHSWPVEFVSGGCSIPIPHARLWWPKGCGRPNLYTIQAELRKGDQVLAVREDKVGVRLLKVRRTLTAGQASLVEPLSKSPNRVDHEINPDSHFVVTVNHQPIMVKGTNWVPLDAFHSRDAGRVDETVALVDDLGCNMIRCWGGNVYEGNRFFDLCDEKGIMVWQDFSFACCRYPQTTDFLKRVQVEVESVVERLRNHACLAIWCGDNEIDMAYVSDGLSPENNRLTREVIPQVLHRLDPYRDYVPSSPYAPPAVTHQVDPWRSTPEQHLWGPRGYYKAPFYQQHSAHFIGEIGYHGCPSIPSIKKFINPGAVWPWNNNEEWHVHDVYHWLHKGVDRDRIKLMANQIKELFGFVPEDMENFVLASQITQAEAKKFFIESTRLRKWQTSGILWWNVRDGWPQFSDAVVDYYGDKKLAYHYIYRSQRPVCLVIGEAGSGKYLPVVACNDSLVDANLTYRITDADSQQIMSEGQFVAPANQNWQIDQIRTFASEQKCFLVEWQIGAEKFGNHYLVGTAPVAFEQYKIWMKAIAQLPRAFDI